MRPMHPIDMPKEFLTVATNEQSVTLEEAPEGTRYIISIKAGGHRIFCADGSEMEVPYGNFYNAIANLHEIFMMILMTAIANIYRNIYANSVACDSSHFSSVSAMELVVEAYFDGNPPAGSPGMVITDIVSSTIPGNLIDASTDWAARLEALKTLITKHVDMQGFIRIGTNHVHTTRSSKVSLIERLEDQESPSSVISRHVKHTYEYGAKSTAVCVFTIPRSTDR